MKKLGGEKGNCENYLIVEHREKKVQNKNLCRYSKSHKKEMKPCQHWSAASLCRICAACNFWEEKSGSIISYKAQIFSFKSPLHPQETTLSFFLLIHSTRISLSSTQIHSGKELNTKCWTLFISFFSFSYKTNKTLAKRTWNKPLGIREPQKKNECKEKQRGIYPEVFNKEMGKR